MPYLSHVHDGVPGAEKSLREEAELGELLPDRDDSEEPVELGGEEDSDSSSLRFVSANRLASSSAVGWS